MIEIPGQGYGELVRDGRAVQVREHEAAGVSYTRILSEPELLRYTADSLVLRANELRGSLNDSDHAAVLKTLGELDGLLDGVTRLLGWRVADRWAEAERLVEEEGQYSTGMVRITPTRPLGPPPPHASDYAVVDGLLLAAKHARGRASGWEQMYPLREEWGGAEQRAAAEGGNPAGCLGLHATIQKQRAQEAALIATNLEAAARDPAGAAGRLAVMEQDM